MDTRELTARGRRTVVAESIGPDARVNAVWTFGVMLKRADEHEEQAAEVAKEYERKGDPRKAARIRRSAAAAAAEIRDAVADGDVAYLRRLIEQPDLTTVDIAPQMVAVYEGVIDVRWVAPVLRARCPVVGQRRGRAPRRRLRTRSCSRGSPRKSEPHPVAPVTRGRTA
jgi:hypothetical protein